MIPHLEEEEVSEAREKKLQDLDQKQYGTGKKTMNLLRGMSPLKRNHLLDLETDLKRMGLGKEEEAIENGNILEKAHHNIKERCGGTGRNAVRGSAKGLIQVRMQRRRNRQNHAIKAERKKKRGENKAEGPKQINRQVEGNSDGHHETMDKTEKIGNCRNGEGRQGKKSYRIE